MNFGRFGKALCVGCWTTAITAVALSPLIYFAVLNYLGPSTEYYEPTIDGAQVLPDGRYVAVIGDRIFVRYIVVRHQINGNCLLKIQRLAENVGGSEPGRRHLLDYAELRFVGQNELRRPRWPLAGLVLGHDVDTDNAPRLDMPLLPPGVDQQEFALFVVARYYCNALDYVFPRYLQGGRSPNETARVHLIVKRGRQ